MPELRFVLILVGALAIAALLIHGLWTSKKEGKAKFSNRPLGKLEDEVSTEPAPERAFSAPEDDFEIVKVDKKAKSKKEPSFHIDKSTIGDPLLDDHQLDEDDVESLVADKEEPRTEDSLPSITLHSEDFSSEEVGSFSTSPDLDIIETNDEVDSALQAAPMPSHTSIEEPVVVQPQPEPEPELEVLVLNVHCSDDDVFIGTKLFNVMERNGLKYGEMDIFHRHVDLSGNGKVLFSVANMMAPGTLNCDNPETFTTKGISFFMTLPCYGDAEQNFKIMLTTAQVIADSMGGHVLDDKRNLMTPNRQDQYKKQIMEYKRAQQPQAS
jgi:cell division protein ZipA